MSAAKRISLVTLILLYLTAGINHFWHPAGYIKIIPEWLPAPTTLNYLAGACEMGAAMLLILPSARKTGAWLIVLMLAAFIPVHIDMLIHAPMKLGSFTVTPLVAWIRLLMQPVLMLWAWWHTLPDHAGRTNTV